jgi:hypothetical protein
MPTPQPRAKADRQWSGGSEPTGEPRSQDTAKGGRGVGLGLTTVLGVVLVAVPLIWAAYYLTTASSSGLGIGFVFLVGIVVMACLGAGALLLRGLFRT